MKHIPFTTNIVLGKEISSWSCECNKVLHSQKEVFEHQHEHALNIIRELKIIESLKLK